MADFVTEAINLFLDRLDQLIAEVRRIADSLDEFKDKV